MAQRRILTATMALLMGSVLGSQACFAEHQLHALVIGNSTYEIGKLRNPANDAEAMSKSLKDLGFEVTKLIDLKQDEMEDAIIRFSRDVGDESLAFLFFAGHGLQVKGENYLVPVDARIKAEFSVRHEAIALSWVLDAMESADSNLNVVVLDCCRDNPFERNWQPSSTRSIGLAEPPQSDIPNGTLIAFATAPGATAADGAGNNSPYTKALTEVLNQRPEEGLALVDAILNASRTVFKETGQKPWLNLDASIPKFYLHPAKSTVGAAVAIQEKPQPVVTEVAIPATNPVPPVAEVEPEETIPPTIQALKRQADVYYKNRDYDNAIAAYAAIIQDNSLSSSYRKLARRSRGAAYLARGEKADLDRAIIDQKAAELPGIYVPIHSKEPQKLLYTEGGKQVTTGWVQKGQVVLITDVNGDWVWVKSVNGDETLRGYVMKSAVLETPEPEPTRSTTAATQPATTQQRQTFSNSGNFNGNQNFSGNQSFNGNQNFNNFNRFNTNNFKNFENNLNRNGADNFTQKYMRKNGRAPAPWETPKWESPGEIRRLRSQGLLR